MPGDDDDAVAPRHTVDVRLVYRRRTPTGGLDVGQSILSATVRADDAFFQPVSLDVFPVYPTPPSLSETAVMTPEQQAGLLQTFKRFQGTLRVGGQSFSSEPFDLAGHLFDTNADPNAALAAGIGTAGGGVFGGLGGLGAVGGGHAKAAADADTFGSVEVELTVHGPGKPDALKRRTTAAAAPAGGRIKPPVLSWELLVQPGPIPVAALGYAQAKQVYDTSGPLVAVLRKADRTYADVERMADDLPAFPATALTFAALRQHGLADALSRNPGLAAVWDAPQVYLVQHWSCACHPDRGVQEGARFDIVANPATFVSRGGPPAPADAATVDAAAAAAATWQGAFDTLAEAALLDKLAPGTELQSSAADLQRARSAGGGPMVAFAAADPAAASASALSADDRDWVDRYEPAGRVILAAAGGGQAGATSAGDAWWSVDPATGSVVGRSHGGGGQAKVEYPSIVCNVAKHVACVAGMVGEAFRFAKAVKTHQGAVANARLAGDVAVTLYGCVTSFAKADWVKPRAWGEAWTEIKGAKAGIAAAVDALAGLN